MTQSKPIYQLDPKTKEIINTYNSAKEAGEAFGRTTGQAITTFISNKRTGKKRYTCYGYDWKYVADDIDLSNFVPFPKNPNYLVNKNGEVYSTKSHQKLNFATTPDGYLKAHLTAGKGEEKSYPVHRMVLLTFNPIENADMYYVNHINGVRTDNRLENLEWTTHKTNVQEMYKNQEKVYNLVQQCIQTVGYEKTCEGLVNLLTT